MKQNYIKLMWDKNFTTSNINTRIRLTILYFLYLSRIFIYSNYMLILNISKHISSYTKWFSRYTNQLSCIRLDRFLNNFFLLFASITRMIQKKKIAKTQRNKQKIEKNQNWKFLISSVISNQVQSGLARVSSGKFRLVRIRCVVQFVYLSHQVPAKILNKFG